MNRHLIAVMCICVFAPMLARGDDIGPLLDAVHCGKASVTEPATRQALQSCNQAIDGGGLTRRNLAATYSNRGVLLAKLGELDEALRDQEQAYRLAKRNGHICMNLANAYFRVGDYERALIFYDRAAKLNPDFTLVYENRSLAHAAVGQQNQAARDLVRVDTVLRGTKRHQALTDR